MSTPHDSRKPAGEPAQRPGKGGRGHGWMMIACCIPMVAIAVILVATGTVSVSFLIAALACTVMMAMMMHRMNHGGNGF
jgi:hypothetical protein